MDLKKKAAKVNLILTKIYPDPVSALIWHTPWEMFVSALLSAQTTDIQVNKITKIFFTQFPSVQDVAKASWDELYSILRPVNYSRSKTSYVLEDAIRISSEFNGEIPSDMNTLLTFKGIGRKVANVIINDVYKAPVGIVVDTHVKRVSNRLGLTKNSNPAKIEQDLMQIFAEDTWEKISHKFIFHGRTICIARKPKCEICPINMFCDYYQGLVKVS